MGAFGAAIRMMRELEDTKSTVLTREELESFHYTTRAFNCKGCTNQCLLTVNQFANGARSISGNKCEKPLGDAKEKERQKLPNGRQSSR